MTVNSADAASASEFMSFSWSSSDSGVASSTQVPGQISSDSATGSESESLTAGSTYVVGALGFTPLMDFPLSPGTYVACYDGADTIYAMTSYTSPNPFYSYTISTGQWTELTTWSGGGNFPFALVYLNGTVYEFASDIVRFYDVDTDTWTTSDNTPPDPGALGQFSLGWAGVVGGNIYLIGSGVEPLTVYRYAPSTDTYTQLTTAPTGPGPQSWGSAVYDGNSLIYYLDGWSVGTPVGRLWTYNIVTDAWAQLSALDSTPSENMYLACVDGDLIAVGGDLDPNFTPTAAVRRYDPDTDTWSALGSLTVARSYIAGVAVGSDLYLLGGTSATEEVSTLEVLSLSTVVSDGFVDSATFTETASVSPVITLGLGYGASWAFIDPNGVNADYYFEHNPNKMSDPTLKKNTTSLGPGTHGHQRAWRTANKAPREWTFSGVTVSKAQQDAFLSWFELEQKVWLRDHLGRVWLVRLTKFAPEPRRPTALNQYRYTYTFTADVYRKVAG